MSLAMDIEPRPEDYGHTNKIKEGYWVNRNGTVLRISEMSDSHLRNVYNLFKPLAIKEEIDRRSKV